MGNPTRKSTALISLVLVPLNLLGLGFTGCDSRDDAPNFSDATSTDSDNADADFAEADDPYNLDPAPPAGGPTAVYPATQPTGNSQFAAMPAHASNYAYYHHSGGGVVFLPAPYRTGYRPIFRSAPTGYRSSSSSVFRSTPTRSSSSFSHSSGTSRGGFGSSAASHSASS